MFYSVPQGHVAILERWGKFESILEPGFNYHNPLTASVKRLKTWGDMANKEGWLIERAEQHQETGSRTCQTLDNVSIKVSVAIYWRIIDPQKAVYDVDSLPQAVNDLALNVLRSEVGKMKLDEVFSRRQAINTTLHNAIRERSDRWGIEFRGVEIRELTYADNVAQAMMKQMTAEKEKLAAVTKAEGKAEAAVKEAEADAQVERIKA